MRVAERLEDKINSLIGLVPASKIATILDDPSLAAKINRLRAFDIATRLARESTGAFSTFALLNLLRAPQLYGASITLDVMLNYAEFRNQSEFRFNVAAKLYDKLMKLLPYSQHLQVELANRGYPQGSFWSLFGGIMQTEHTKYGLERAVALTRPVTQSIAAISEIPRLVVLLSMGLTYASLPLFSRMGSRDKVIEDRAQLIEEASSRSQLYGISGIEDKLVRARRKFVTIRENNYFAKSLLGKIQDVGFLGMVLFARNESMGVFRYIQQLFSTPLQYRNFRENGIDIKRSIGIVNSLYSIISGNPYMLTDASWDAYRRAKLKRSQSSGEMDEVGIRVDSLRTQIPDKHEQRYTPSLSFSAKPGEVVYLHGESGIGKSITTGLGLAGVLPTEGIIQFRDEDGQTQSLEDLTREELGKRVVYVAPNYGFEQLRVCDIYQKRTIDLFVEKWGKTRESLTEYEILMLSVPDAYLERELYALARDIRKIDQTRPLYGFDNPDPNKVDLGGVLPVFPTSMFGDIYAFRQERNRLVEEILRSRGSNLVNIKADSPIGHLSTGMKTRFMWEMQNEIYATNGQNGRTRIMVLDEPFGALDKTNTSEYLDTINEITMQPHPPVVLLISHQREDMVRQKLGEKLKEVYFDKSR